MEQITEILNQKIGTESALSYKDEKCPKCGSDLWKLINIFGKDKYVRSKCPCEMADYRKKHEIELAKEKQIRLNALIKNSLMDQKFQSQTFENWDHSKGSKQMYDFLFRYAKNFSKCKENGLGMLMYGPPGGGKTYGATAIANELLKIFIPVICVSINGLLSTIQQTYSRYGKEAEADIIRGLCNADLLIIDDLGVEKNTDWSRSMIYNIIDNRYRSNLPLIITTNLDINPKVTDGILTDLYGRRTEDRILEKCTPIKNSTSSIRIEEAKKNTDLLKKILY